MIKAFQCAHRSCPYGHCLAVVRYEFFQCVARDGDVFRMHFMPFYFFTFHRFEGSGSHMECQLFQFYSFIAQCVQYAWGEMQSRCRGSHRTFDFGIDSLVSLLVTFLGFPVQVGRDGQFTEDLENVGKSHFRIIPAEVYPMAGSVAFAPFGGQGEWFAFHGHLTSQHAFFPFFQVADHAEPSGMLGLLEVEGIVVRLYRF